MFVGASHADNEEGAVYIYTRTPSGWSEEKVVASDRADTAASGFGYAVSACGDAFVVGCGDREGAYVYRLLDGGVAREEAGRADSDIWLLCRP